ncbi:hypothetical protein F8388_025141 [Cannabis sativa]|uniref:DUF4283 domain-containing protein n=1 Tax=Cannabis sativa TaxID=3483 RepID=A0A7J6FJ70_CANSA|nr:hypothetical protein F8388_025141 [Cannabis sativa]
MEDMARTNFVIVAGVRFVPGVRLFLSFSVMASSSSPVDLSLEHVSIIPLEKEEEPAVSYEGPLIDEAEVDTRWSIMGCFLTNTSIDFMVMRNMMVVLWKPGMGMYVKELRGKKYIFQFYHEIGIQRVMDRSPWMFKNAPLIFKWLKLRDVPREVPSHHLDIWVQLHDIRSGFKTERVVRDARNYIGRFIKYDENNFNAVLSDNNGSKRWEAVGDSNSNLEEVGMVFLDSKCKRTSKEVSIGPVGPKEGVDKQWEACVSGNIVDKVRLFRALLVCGEGA